MPQQTKVAKEFRVTGVESRLHALSEVVGELYSDADFHHVDEVLFDGESGSEYVWIVVGRKPDG